MNADARSERGVTAQNDQESAVLVVWRMPRSLRLALAALAVLFVLGAIAVAAGYLAVADERSRLVSLPSPTGPYAVGRASFDWVDQSREEPLGKPGDKRELLAWVWYPAEDTPGATLAPYLPTGLVSLREGSPWSLVYQRADTVRVHAVADAPVAAGGGRFPVLVFMPGMGHSALDYTSVVEDLASRGFVVVGVDPTYSTDVAFNDGRLVPSSIDAREPSAQDGLNALVASWALDARFAISQLEALDASSRDRLAGRLDLARIGLFGHSFGGAASLLACSEDERCKAVADIDGSPYGRVAEIGLGQPALFVMSEDYGTDCLDCASTASDIGAIRQRNPADSLLLVIAGARHGNYQDWAVTFAPAPMLLGAMGTIDGTRGLRITGDYLAAFFGRHLAGSDELLLRGPSPAYPEARFIGG